MQKAHATKTELSSNFLNLDFQLKIFSILQHEYLIVQLSGQVFLFFLDNFLRQQMFEQDFLTSLFAVQLINSGKWKTWKCKFSNLSALFACLVNITSAEKKAFHAQKTRLIMEIS